MALCQLLQHPAAYSQLTMYLSSQMSMRQNEFDLILQRAAGES